jgi:hypothetical protein
MTNLAGHHHRLVGLEPDNLLAFLALLGLLRALETARPEWRPRAVWDLDCSPLRPALVLREEQTPEEISDAVAHGAACLAETYRFPAGIGLDAAPQRDLSYAGDVARRLLKASLAEDGRERADLWAALMCDAAAKEGRIEATPLCLLFGQGHQHFLERLATVPSTVAPPPRGRGNKAIVITAGQTMHEALFQPWARQDPTPAFRWDPAEDVRYALRADDPSGTKATTQHGANRLAALGLAALTTAPAQRGNRVRLQILGGWFERNDFSFAWPIWRDPASLAAIRALLSHPRLREGPEVLAHLGVAQVRRSRRIGVGKFMNFTRAEPL